MQATPLQCRLPSNRTSTCPSISHCTYDISKGVGHPQPPPQGLLDQT